ncbi:membrane protein insertion efficiency factor YidD [Actinomyces mediterranea]|uniref:membrane protein insertion efficiency factor YidD n=1 Tax=Actinomyces mediterranea TaxID=1871028 RepID=UPI0009708384|nr:membrane protein insertion efficiency factor YidD [Actinomyces mediterranea]
MNLMSRLIRGVFTAPIRLYQRFISPMLTPRCRYAPTCSNYAVEAIDVHGLLKGLVLAVWRLLRCNPWSLGGVDYVPKKGRWTSEKWIPPEDWAGNATDIDYPTPMGMTPASTNVCGAHPQDVPANADRPQDAPGVRTS